MSTNLSSYIPSLYEDRASNYVDPESIIEKQELTSENSKSLSFHAQFLRWPYSGIFHILPIILGLTLIKNNQIISSSDLLLLKLILLFGSLIALLSFLPSFGRFKAFIILPSILLLFNHWSIVMKSFRPVVITLVFMMMLYSFVKLRTALDAFSLTTILGNPISLFITDIDSRTSLIDFIK
jgi:hypothetical protein